jgi:hypothetical protein
LSDLKRAWVHGALIVFALWPAAHIGLVKAWNVNPWKLAGWGMYAAPQIPAELRITSFTAGEAEASPLLELPAELEATQYAFLRARLGLGDLARPAKLARALLEHDSTLAGVSIEVVQPVLNPGTGIVEERRTTYAYRR